MNRAVAFAIGVALALPIGAAEPLELKTDTDRLSYSLGHEIGADFKRQGAQISVEALARGVNDALSGAASLLGQDEMEAILAEFQGKMIADRHARNMEESNKKRAATQQFLEENARKEGVVTLPSGLQYRVLKEGTGKSPAATDTVTVNYKGTKSDGSEFDSTHKHARPAKFQLDHVVKGWAEGLQLMKEGARYELVIPPDLAYGDRGRLANEVLIFDVELISVGPPEEGPPRPHGQSPHGQPSTGGH
jgi:FKBP-type peptidyl-prolyl cis-trans isomerase FklB